MSRLFRILLLLVVSLVLNGCQQLKSKGLLNERADSGKLRVGIAVDAPPLAYKKDTAITGLEVQFAAGLAASLGKTPELVELPRTKLAKALLNKKIDIIMAGLTVIEAHQQKLATATPYLLSGQVPLVHLDDYKLLGNSTENLTGRNVRIGVIDGSPGESLLRGLKPKGKTSRFASAPEGVQALIDDTIDVFITDLPTNFYYASLYIDKGLTPGATPMTREELTWAVHPKDTAMQEAANAYLAAIEKNGELQALLERSIPFYRNTAYSPKQ